MPDFDALPFPIGSTFFSGNTADATSGNHLEGREFEVPDLNYSGGVSANRAYGTCGATKTVRIVRNTSAIALLPRRMVKFKLSAYGLQVDGYTTTTAEEGYLVDEFLGSAGVPVNDLFYIVVKGAAEGLMPLSAGADNVYIAGSTVLVAITAATSGATTAGRLGVQAVTGATTSALMNQFNNRLGVALSARTTDNTGGSTVTTALVHVWKKI